MLCRAHAVPPHVLLAILKCPVSVLMENCLLDTRKEFHKASISYLTRTHAGFLSSCNRVKSFQTRDLVSLLPFEQVEFCPNSTLQGGGLSESRGGETHMWLCSPQDKVVILAFMTFLSRDNRCFLVDGARLFQHLGETSRWWEVTKTITQCTFFCFSNFPNHCCHT